MSNYLIYGANGYTGELTACEAVKRGQRPILAGRNRESISALASELGLDSRAFSLDNSAEVDAGLEGIDVVLHCAGPFSRTSKPMVDGCLRKRVHYLDITGEIAVFEACAARDAESKSAGVMLMPGVGFDVVPSDCLAAHLKRRLPSARQLTLAMHSLSSLSRGTLTTMVENIQGGGMIRKGGVLTCVPAAWKMRKIDFGAGAMPTITIPWGDVATAYYSTKIPDIEVYSSASWSLRLAAKASRYLGWFLGSTPVQNYLKKRIRSGPPGPSAEQRTKGKSHFWGEAVDATGQRMISRLQGPEGYTMTVLTSLAVVERVLSGQAMPGFRTPSMMFGPDFVLEVSGVTREDVGETVCD